MNDDTALTPAGDDPRPHHWHCARDIRFRALVEAGCHTDPPAALLQDIAAAIQRCCGHRPVKAHRLARGLTVRQTVAALRAQNPQAAGLDERRWRDWDARGRISADYQDMICRLFRAGPLQLGFAVDYTDKAPGAGRAPGVTGTTGRRPTPPRQLPERRMAPCVRPSTGRVSAARRTPPHPVHPVRTGTSGAGTDAPPGPPAAPLTTEGLIMAAHESAFYADHPSNVGPATLEQLRADTTRVARMFANAPRAEVFTQARWLRDRTFALLDGRQRVNESRDLYFLAAAACGMLGAITEELGLFDAAMTHMRTAWMCAEQAGDTGLKAWILGEQGLIAYFDGRYAQAAEYARRGQEHQPAGAVGVWLPALEGRARSQLGDAERTRAAIERGRKAREQVRPGNLDEFGGILSFPVPKQHHYDAESYLGIGDAPAVIVEAEACITGYQAGPEEERAYDNEVSAQANLATAHVLGGELEAASAAVQPVFGIRPDLRIHSIDQRLRLLYRRLCAPAVRDSPVAVALRDQIEDFLAQPTTALPPAT